MIIFNLLISILWAIFIIYWIISAKNVKKDIKQGKLKHRYLGVFILVLSVILFSQFHFFQKSLIHQTPLVGITGVTLSTIGIALAIWARRYLGANWSSKPAIKESHELVTSGPYRLIRHPIYTGVLLAIFGSTLVSNAIWFIILICICVMFILRIKTEEQFMTKIFGKEYNEYKGKTKALVPFIW